MLPCGLSLLAQTHALHGLCSGCRSKASAQTRGAGHDACAGLQVRRFSRYVLGEGLEKRSTDFAAEVAAQTGQA